MLVQRPRDMIVALSLLAIVVSEALTMAKVEPFYSWNTPVCWTAFIIFADTVVYRSRGQSLIRSTPREFAWLVALSIPLWLVFEGYNRIIRNWYYVGLPENWWLRMFGYAWSFATIWPAIFEGADLVALSAGRLAPSGVKSPHAAASAYPVNPAVLMTAGTAMLLCPFVVPADVARYLAAPVWLGFIFLLDPVNKRLGGPSVTDEANRTIDLLLSGLLCGVLWEFWNYWAGAKWHYAVPIMEHVKIFEMPLPGYLGFPPFAVECFVMFTFMRLMFRKVAG